MKRKILITTLIICIAFSFAKAQSVKINELRIKAPFDEVVIKLPDFSKCKKFYITNFGAVQGDKEKTSLAIAKAIDQANKNRRDRDHSSRRMAYRANSFEEQCKPAPG